jgi:hypothetical protein
MWVTLGAFLLSMTGSLVARVLLTLGIGFVSYTSFNSLAVTFTQNVASSYSLVPQQIFQILNLAGGGTAMVIISSAIVTKASIMAIAKLGKILTG